MKVLRKLCCQLLCVVAWTVAVAAPPVSAQIVPAPLAQLAARAGKRGTWPAIRAYAQSTKNPEWRGWAYFLVGYQEYENDQFTEAVEDLERAAATGFPLADYAVFYKASAASRLGQSAEAAETLKDFGTRFPNSYMRWQALELGANALLESQMPPDALEALNAVAEVRKRPPLALLLAQAYKQANRTLEAVRAFQEVYFGFPTSPQAKVASEQLEAMRGELGPAYPAPSEELQTSRAELLFRAGRYEDALKEFAGLLKSGSASTLAPQWQMGQARCLLRLRRTADAAEALFTHYAAPDLEARRLALLVQLHVQQADAAGISQDLAQLETLGPAQPAYADALSSAGMFYYRQLDWQQAANAYQRLLELFPQSSHVRDDGWRLAWCYYLLRDPKAPEAMQNYLTRFPDSPRAAAIVYWLGRVKEEQGAPAEARALYDLVRKRFVHSYYAQQALTRLSPLRNGKDRAADDDAAASLAAKLGAALPSTTPAPGFACPTATPSEAARPAAILRTLVLNDLASGYVKAAIAEGPAAELRLLLAHMQAQQGETSDALFDAVRAAPAYPQLAFSELPKDLWDILYPQAYKKLIQRQARVNRLDLGLVLGIIRQESSFNPHALSSADARGLMQVLPETAARSHRPASLRSAGRRLYEPSYNVRVGCSFLKGLMKMFDGWPELAVAAYHAGDFRVRDWTGKYSFPDSATFLESIPIPATRVYVEAVLRDAQVYRELNAGSARFAACTGSRGSTPARPAAKGQTGKTPATKRRHTATP